MAPDLEVCCPRPTRPLKRKLSQLDDELDRSYPKRPLFFDPILLRTFPRSRSDSFLTFAMNPNRYPHLAPKGTTNQLDDIRRPNVPLRPTTTQPSLSHLLSPASNLSGQHHLPPWSNFTPHFAGAQPKLDFSHQQWPSTIRDPAATSTWQQATPPPYGLTPVSLATTPASFGSGLASSYTSLDGRNSRQEEKTVREREDLLRVSSPTYRDELYNHNIQVCWDADDIEEDVLKFSRDIIDKRRASPGLQPQDIASDRQVLKAQADTPEQSFREAVAKTKLLPDALDYPTLRVADEASFGRVGMPHVSGHRFRPLPLPRSDKCYGYPRSAFDNDEADRLGHHRLKHYAQPVGKTFWPFFMVEYKSPSSKGSTWVAENQNAGSGAHSVNSLEVLFEHSQRCQAANIKSIAFSCVADCNNASIWVHWCKNEGERRLFSSSEIANYHLKTASERTAFRNNVRNIIDYGVGERLTGIKEILREILLPDLDALEKKARMRKVSQDAGVDSSDKRR